MACQLAAFAKYFDNQDRSDVTIIITTEGPETCRARKSGQQQPFCKRQCRHQQDGPPAEQLQEQLPSPQTSAAGAGSQVAAEEAATSDEEVTAIELHGHAVVLSAHSQFFDIASSRNNFNKRLRGEQDDEDDAGHKLVVVSVDSEEDVEAAALMIKTMYGIQLPEDISTTQLVSTLRLAHQYRVEPALRSSLQRLQQLLTTVFSGPWSATHIAADLLAVYSTSSRPTAYECVLAEAQAGGTGEAPEVAAGAQLLPALAAEVLELMRVPFTQRKYVERAAAMYAQDGFLWEFLQTLRQLPAAEMAHLLSSEQLQVVCEDTVFALALRWLQANQDASTDDRRTVWNAIRLPGLSPWLKAMVLGGLPEATELMDCRSRQHAAACFISGKAVRPAHLGTSACTYGSDTLSWSKRTYSQYQCWRARPHFWEPGTIEALVQDGAHIRKLLSCTSSWVCGGMLYLLQLQASDVPGDQVDVAVAVCTAMNWYKERPRSEQAWAPAAMAMPGLFAVKAGSWQQPRVMTPPAGSDPSLWNLLAESSLGTFPKSAVGAAQLQRMLTGPDGELQLVLYKCDDDGTPRLKGVQCNGSGGRPFPGPTVQTQLPAA